MKTYTDFIKYTLTLLLSFFLWTGQANSETQHNKDGLTLVVTGCNVGFWTNTLVPGGSMISSALKLSPACLGLEPPSLELSSGTGSWKINKTDGSIHGYTIHHLIADGQSPKIVILKYSTEGDYDYVYSTGGENNVGEGTISGAVFDAEDFVDNLCLDSCTPLLEFDFPAEFTFKEVYPTEIYEWYVPEMVSKF